MSENLNKVIMVLICVAKLKRCKIKQSANTTESFDVSFFKDNEFYLSTT